MVMIVSLKFPLHLLPQFRSVVDVDTRNINLQTMLPVSTSFATNMNMSVKRSYHHGNLRKALLDAGVALIGEVGPKGFTIREVARRAGVSHNAPYRHFRDKDELLEAIALEGFGRLTAAMKKRSAAGARIPSMTQSLKMPFKHSSDLSSNRRRRVLCPREIRIHWHLWLGPWCMVSQNWRSAENCPTVPNRFLISLKSPQRHS